MTQKSPTEVEKEPMMKSTLMFSEHYRVTAKVVLISLGSIALFGGLGYLLDQWLGSNPFLMILGILLSFPVTQFLIFKWVHKKYVPGLVNKSKSS